MDNSTIVIGGNASWSTLIEFFVHSLGSDKLSSLGGTYEGGKRLQQIPDEIAPCIADLVGLNCLRQLKNFLEIGSAAGGTAFLFNHYFQFENIVLIDDNIYLKKIKQPELRHENLKGMKYIEIIGNSRAVDTLEKFRALKMTFDFMIIDGDHRPTHIDRDVILYTPFLNPKGYLMLHDTVEARGVKAVFNRLKEDEKYIFINEYVSKTQKRPCGIGIFQRR